MRILIYEPNGILEKFFHDFVIAIGIIPLTVDDTKMILPQLKISKYDILLCDYSNNIDVITDILFNMKLDASLATIKIFISTPRPERDVLENLIKLGINGFIKKPFLQDDFKNIFENWVNKNSFKEEKRKHVRVVPQPTDNAFAMLPARFVNSQIKCSIIDISVGGIAIIPPPHYEKLMNTTLKVNDIIKGIRLKIRHFGINVDIKVIDVHDDRINLCFTNHDEKSHKYLYRYIADNIER